MYSAVNSSGVIRAGLKTTVSLVIGEAEHVWQNLLKDAQAGRLKRIYTDKHSADLTAFPKPVRSKLSMNRYLADILQTTKGCPFQCEFCSVYAYDGQRIRHKTIEQVLNEITEIHDSSNSFKRKSIFFADDNIIGDKKYARELFAAITNVHPQNDTPIVVITHGILWNISSFH